MKFVEKKLKAAWKRSFKVADTDTTESEFDGFGIRLIV